MKLLIGLDDTDSSRGLCTTYLAYRIATDLRPRVRVLPYPRLVRLNPNVPFKTRGNAAVCLLAEADDPYRAFELVSSKVREFSDVDGGANSGMVFLEDLSLARVFSGLYADALTGIVNPRRVERILSENGVRYMQLGNGMGVVGAAAALGFDPAEDRTFELISYRRSRRWGEGRVLDPASVKDLERRTYPHTFNSFDYQKRKVLVAPHGPDPVFAGIRGDSPSSVRLGFKMLRYGEPLDGWMVFATNQHTDAHLRKALDWKTYSSGWVEGRVSSVEVGEGGHVYFTILGDGRSYDCAAYEPTGDLRRVARLLSKGDLVKAYGGVRRATTKHAMVLNVEKLEVLKASTRGGLVPGTYISSPRANRHLTKPFARYMGVPAQESQGPWLRDLRASPRPARSR